MTADQFITIKRAADLLVVSQSTVRRMVQSGELPAVRVRRLLRIPAAAIEKISYLESQEYSAAPKSSARA